MSNLKTGLERIADAGVEGIALIPLRAPEPRRSGSRRVIAVLAAVCVVVAAVAVAAAVRSPDGRQPPTRDPSGLVPDASYHVPSESMSPTLRVDDTVSAATKFDAIKRGDVVRILFRKEAPGVPAPPPDGDAGFKRIVGLPGETVEGRGGDVFVNGRKLVEPYADRITVDFGLFPVPRGFYFVLGDNRSNSRDSRYYGPIPRSAIRAIALRITAPADRAGRIPGSPRR
jgi:signal peptidase I